MHDQMEIHRQRAAEYHNQVMAVIAKMRKEMGKGAEITLPVIKPGTAEWDAWERYFREYRGFMPIVMTLAKAERTKAKSFTVPSQWPEWFDAGYKQTQDGISRTLEAPPMRLLSGQVSD